MTVEPGSREWNVYTGNPDDYPVWHDYHYRSRGIIVRTYGSGGGYYSPETRAAGNLPPGEVERESPQQLEAKRQVFQNPSAQWASQEDYERAYQSYLSEGGTPISHPAGIIPGSTQEQRRAEAATYDASTAAPQVHQQGSMLKNPFTGEMMYDVRPDPYAGVRGIPGAEWLATQRQQAAPQQTIRRAAPVTAGLYETSVALTKQIQSAVGGAIGYSPTAHPGIKVLFGASSLITGLPQMAGMAAVVGEFAIRNPGRVPEAVVGGLPLMAAELTKQVQTSPFETAGMVAAMVVAPRVGKIVSEKMPAVKVRGLEIPKGAGVIDKIAPNRPAISWKQFKTEKGLVGEAGAGMSQELATAVGGKHTMINIKAHPIPVLPIIAGGGLSYQGISVEQGRKSQPIIGITDQPVTNLASLKIGDKTIVAGTPKFKPEAVPEIYKSQFMSDVGVSVFSNPTEYNIAMKNILPTYDPAIRGLVEGSIAKRQLTFGVKSTHQLRDVPLEDVFTRHELGLATQKNLRAYMQQQKDFIIWGSSANKAQVMGKGGVGYFREIHDIDIHVKNPALTTKELLAVIRKTEKPGKVSMKKDGGLTTEKGTLFDVKPLEGGIPEKPVLSSSEQSLKGSNFYFPEEKNIKIGKFTTQSLSSQATAKLSSVGLREKTVSAAPWRAGKDPFDLAFINEPSLTKDLARSLNPFKRMKAGKAEKLDIKIQELTEAKIGKQAIGDMPGQITAQQKKLFFDNLRALRAGQPVLAAPKSEMLYVSPVRSKPSLPAPGNIMRAGGISTPSSQPHIRHEGGSYPGQPRLPSQTYDQGSISRQIHQVISNQKMMFSPPRLSGSVRGSGRSGVPGYYAGMPASRSGISPPSGSGRSIPVYPSGIVSPPRITISPPSPPVYPRSSVDYPRATISPPSLPPVSFGGGGGMPRDIFKPPKLPKFDTMGGPRKHKGRRESAYEIRNPLSGLKELIGKF